MEHQSGKSVTSYTAQRLPVILKYFEIHTSILKAIKREKQLKKWSRAKKEALINCTPSDLHYLAKKRFVKTPPSIRPSSTNIREDKKNLFKPNTQEDKA
jgi:putative endonuclease